MINASHRTGRWLVLLVLGLGLPAMACVGLRIPSTIQFFSMMSRAPAWTEFDAANYGAEAFQLGDYQAIASFLQQQLESHRRRLLALYDYSFDDFSDVDRVSSGRLFILMRVLFDLPETYPCDDSIPQSLFTPGSPNRDFPHIENVNLLWPLEHKGNQLTLEGTFLPTGPFWPWRMLVLLGTAGI